MAQAAPLRDVSAVKKNEWPVDASLFKWNNKLLWKMDGWKCCFEKNLVSLQKRDALNRSS